MDKQYGSEIAVSEEDKQLANLIKAAKSGVPSAKYDLALLHLEGAKVYKDIDIDVSMHQCIDMYMVKRGGFCSNGALEWCGRGCAPCCADGVCMCWWLAVALAHRHAGAVAQ